MKYKSCLYIESGIVFRPAAISICNSWNSVMAENNINIFYPTEKVSTEETLKLLDEFNSVRIEKREQARNGILPYNECNTCVQLKEQDWDLNNNQFKEIQIGHFLNCNSGCTYCCNIGGSRGKITLDKQNNPTFQLLPVLKKMYEMNLVSPDAFFVFNGGESTMLKEFPDIMNLILKQKNTNYSFNFNSNGIVYNKLISKALNSVKTPERLPFLCISVDAGTRETFKRIKRVDKFKDVMNTQKKYVKDLKKHPDRIVSKYVIVENVNDNKEEILKWIENSKKLG